MERNGFLTCFFILFIITGHVISLQRYFLSLWHILEATIFFISHKNRKKGKNVMMNKCELTCWFDQLSMSQSLELFGLYFYSKKYRKRNGFLIDYSRSAKGNERENNKLLQTGRNVRFGQNKLRFFGLRLCPFFFRLFFSKRFSLYPLISLLQHKIWSKIPFRSFFCSSLQ